MFGVCTGVGGVCPGRYVQGALYPGRYVRGVMSGGAFYPTLTYLE